MKVGNVPVLTRLSSARLQGVCARLSQLRVNIHADAAGAKDNTMRTLIDEYGDTGIIQPENRRDSEGFALGPKPRAIATMGYDQKQIESPVEPRLMKLRNCRCASCAGTVADNFGRLMAE